MSDDNQAVTRGPDYDWKHEAEHYRLECEKLRELLFKVEASGEKYAYEHRLLKNALTYISEYLLSEKDSNYYRSLLRNID